MPRKRATEPCSCGCGQMPVSGKFCAGHDQKMLHKIREKAGGIFMLEAIVNKHLQGDKEKIKLKGDL